MKGECAVDKGHWAPLRWPGLLWGAGHWPRDLCSFILVSVLWKPDCRVRGNQGSAWAATVLRPRWSQSAVWSLPTDHARSAWSCIWAVGSGLTYMAQGCPPAKALCPATRSTPGSASTARPCSSLSSGARPHASSHWPLSRRCVLATGQEGRPHQPRRTYPVLRKR